MAGLLLDLLVQIAGGLKNRNHARQLDLHKLAVLTEQLVGKENPGVDLCY